MHIRWNIEQSETRRMWKKYNIDAEQSEARNFFEKIKIRALKFIILLLNYTLGPPNLGVRGGPAPPPPDPLVYKWNKIISILHVDPCSVK